MDDHVELARQQWEGSYRRLALAEGDGDPRVHEQLEVVTAELRRRIGALFTLAELARLYDGSERWTVAAIAERCPSPGWARTASAVADAAFHLYARGARDFRP